MVTTANDADNTDPRAGGRHSGRIPLTLDELTAIATTRSLAVTAPVIPAVPLMRSCGAFTDGNGPELTQEKMARLDRARLEIVVASGQPEASPQDEYLNEIDPNRITTVSADGSTVTRGFYPEHGSAYFSIVLPSTQQIIISTPIGGSTVPVTLAQIEYLATATELALG